MSEPTLTEPLSFDLPTRADAPHRDRRSRLVVRSLFLAILAVLSAARVVPLPAQAVLPLAAIGLVLNGAMALGKVGGRAGFRVWTPMLDLGLLYVLVAYTPAPQSWGALAYVWLAGQAVVTTSSRPERTLPLYGLAAWLALALASLQMAHPVAYMAGHTIALALFVGVARSFLRERRQSSLDPLTGTLTRRAGLLELERRLARGLPFEVAVVDVRDFKRVNDAHGHAAGDHALRIIGRRLHHVLRSEDAVIRYGGDEFVVVSDLDGLEARLRSAFADPLRTRYGILQIGVDVGVVAWRRGLALSDILAEADRRMYARKRAG